MGFDMLEGNVVRAKRALQICGGGLGVLGAVVAGLLGYAEWTSRRSWDAPFPPIHADRSPAALARGRTIFDVKCAGCHQAPDHDRARGKHMADLPPPLGTFYAANLTRHPTAGIGGLDDREIARALRYGVTHDGRRSIMGWALSDEDLAAVIGYLRSDDPRFAPDDTVQPHSRPALVGKIVLAYVMGAPRDLPASGIHAPPASDPVRYGAYLAKAVYECADCHTAGFSPDKADGEMAFRGGMELVGADGRSLFSRNLTFHETGLAGWSFEDFRVAMKDGIPPRGEPLRAPMPRFRALDDDELRAIYGFLRTLPPGESGAPVDARPQRPPRDGEETKVLAAASEAEPAAAEHPGAELFKSAGCGACHAAGAPLHDKLQAARGKSVDELVRWIRHPELVKPGTPMPTFAAVVDEDEARTLAEWIRAGTPASPGG